MNNKPDANDKNIKVQDEMITRQKLLELEKKEKTSFEKIVDGIILLLPFVCAGIAVLEYIYIPNNVGNPFPERYIIFISFLMCLYALFLIVSIVKNMLGNFTVLVKARHYAPLYSAVLLLLAVYDYLTLKTGILTHPFIPCINSIINAGIADYVMLIDCTKNTLILLFLGYFAGVLAGLITGILCGYYEKFRYWISPIINILGPIPTVTWVPIMMVIVSSLYAGSVFIIALGAWFAVTVATMTGIIHVNKDYFEAAKTLGASTTQLVSRIAIPGAIPSILQGCTQAMSSACVSILIAEMLGVESGLGWYITWQKSWASYDKMFAALFIICLVFILVTKTLGRIKKYLLRWQIGDDE